MKYLKPEQKGIKIQEIGAKSIITKSGLPDSDFVINPYIGCVHRCIYCYAVFMKRFTNHREDWGRFLDVKINAAELIPEKSKRYKNKYKDRTISISSVTDPYQPAEKKYRLMRGILTKLIPLEPNLCIMTKSDLILRDCDLLKRFKKVIAGVSLAFIDDKTRKQTEPLASSVKKRINAVKELKKNGIRTFVFISPIFPELSDWQKIILETRDFADEFWFENLNVRATNWKNIHSWLKEYHPELLKRYREIYFTPNNYWKKMESNIESFCEKNKLNYTIYFHH